MDLVVMNVDVFFGARSRIEAKGPDVRAAARAAALLRAGGRRVVLASSLAPEAVDAVLDAAAVGADVFDDVVAIDSGRRRPNLVRIVLDDHGVDGARAAAIACAPIDLYEALGAGCETIVGVATARHAAWELRRHPHTAVAASFHEAVELLQDLHASRPRHGRAAWRSCNEPGNPG